MIWMNTSIYEDEYDRLSGSLPSEFHSTMVGDASRFRSSLLRCGYLPVPLRSGKKAPFEPDWPVKADARAGLTQWFEPISWWNWNSGISCAGLFAVDVDVDDPAAAKEVTAALFDVLGSSPAQRVRGYSSRYLALYRAEGKPKKRKVGKIDGYKVDILSDGQQCMAHGVHPSFEMVEWITPEGRSFDGIARVPCETLPLIKAAQIDEFFVRCRVIFGIDDEEPEPAFCEPWMGERRERGDYTDDDVADIVAHLPADTGYDDWLTVLSAIFNATGGSARGRDLAHEYSGKSPAYRREPVEKKWRAFCVRGGLRHDFGYLLNRVRQMEPGYLTPSFRAKLSAARRGCTPTSAGVAAGQVIMDADF